MKMTKRFPLFSVSCVLMIVVFLLSAAPITLFAAGQAEAGDESEFPTKQITMIVPFSAGGGSDRVARIVDQFWQTETGQSFEFQYQPGAGGAVGTDTIARADADGYTIGIVNLPNLVIQPVSGTASFELTDFDYLGQVNSDPIVLVVPENSPYKSLEDFVNAASENPGTLTLAITGTMTSGHLAALKLMDTIDIDVTLVPTQGGSNTIARVAGGHVSAGLLGLGFFSAQDSGRALAVTSAERSDFLPEVPTFTELGYSFEQSTARIIIAPDGVPTEDLDYLRTTLQSVTQNQGFADASRKQGQGAIWLDGASLEEMVMNMEEDVTRLLNKFDLLD